MGAIASQITSLTIVYSTVYSGADQSKHQSSTSLALCAGNSSGTGEFPAQMASKAGNVSFRWRHHDSVLYPSDYEWFRPKKTNIQQKGVIGELTYSRPNRMSV